jgi:hypothetical protein
LSEEHLAHFYWTLVMQKKIILIFLSVPKCPIVYAEYDGKTATLHVKVSDDGGSDITKFVIFDGAEKIGTAPVNLATKTGRFAVNFKNKLMRKLAVLAQNRVGRSNLSDPCRG